MLEKDLTREFLLDLFNYDREEGILYWKKSPARCIKAGSEAGTIDEKGYIRVKIKNKSFRVHRLIWIIEHGSIGETDLIDHKDTITFHNQIDNLRLANNALNQVNAKGRGVSKYRGVCRAGKRWVASLKVNGATKHLGTYDTEEEAHNVYLIAAEEIYGEFVYKGMNE